MKFDAKAEALALMAELHRIECSGVERFRRRRCLKAATLWLMCAFKAGIRVGANVASPEISHPTMKSFVDDLEGERAAYVSTEESKR